MKLKEKINLFAVGVFLAQGSPSQEPQGVLNDWFKSSPGTPEANRGIRRLFGLGAGPAGQESIGGLITTVLQILLMVAGGIAVIFLVLGGIRYIASRGNEEATEAAKKTMTSAIVGLIVVIMAFAMVFIISQILVTGAPGTGIGP